jgi:Leucine-rich repeat (LRR) protein
LTNLEFLDIRDNNITDISPRIGLENLSNVLLEENPLSSQQLDEFEKTMPGIIMEPHRPN